MPTIITHEDEEIALKSPVMLRLGRRLRELIDARAGELGLSRNAWIVRAAERRMEDDEELEEAVTAEMIAEGKEPMMVRFDPFLIELIDEHAEERGVRRTTWLTDACLAALAHNGIDPTEV